MKRVPLSDEMWDRLHIACKHGVSPQMSSILSALRPIDSVQWRLLTEMKYTLRVDCDLD